MSMLVRVTLAIAEVLAGGMLGAMAGLWWARRSEPVELHDEAATIDTEPRTAAGGGVSPHAGGGGAIAQRAYEPAGQAGGRE